MKKKAMTILYEVHNGLYVNLTNRCSCACTFCVRQTDDAVGKSDTLWLEHEPSFEEVMEAFNAFNMINTKNWYSAVSVSRPRLSIRSNKLPLKQNAAGVYPFE